MKLLFAHENLGEFGGAETNVQLAAEELRKRGCQIDLLYCQRTGRNEAAWEAPFRERLRLQNQRERGWIKGVLEDLEPELIYLHNLADLDAVEALLDSNIPVVRMVHDHSLYCLRSYKYNYFTRRICTRPSSGYCVLPCLASVARSRGGKLPIKWVSYASKRREIELNRRCAHFVVYSEYQKEELRQNGFAPDKIEICVPIRPLNGTSPASAANRQNLVLYAGQIVRGKGVDVLLRALARVRAEFHCVILGDGNHRPYCERLCERLGLASRVQFRGYVPPSESQGLYARASVFVMSSLWPEPFGMAGPEAMRHGLPVVAFDAGGIREWLIDGCNGYLIPWKDIDFFAARVEELLCHKDRACRLGQTAAQWSARYDSTRQLDTLQRLFERVIRQRSGRAMCVPPAELNPICL